MFALNQNVTNATLCVVLSSMLTNTVELISICIDKFMGTMHNYGDVT